MKVIIGKIKIKWSLLRPSASVEIKIVLKIKIVYNNRNWAASSHFFPRFVSIKGSVVEGAFFQAVHCLAESP